MARQEKGSRMRMLPPRVQLQQRDALTGSYPTTVRFSTDGRTGKYSISFNDTYTVNFTSSNQYIPAIGFPVGNIWLNNSQSNDLTGSIVTTGSIRTQTIDGLPFFHFTPGQEITPFRDNDQPAVDGKSSGDSFYATGSAVADVGEGFTSPLWSKNKIEIDISSTEDTSLQTFVQGLGTTKNLAYYNFITKKWEPLVGQHGPQTSNAFGTTRMAFTPSLMTWANGLEPGNKGLATTTYGFPFHSLYAATSSQLLSMKDYINEPFLLEKVVVNFTGSFQSGFDQVFEPGQQYDESGGEIEFSSSYAVNNVFILNQRLYNVNTRVFSGFYDVDTKFYINTTIPNGTVNTVRDLIGFGSIASFNNAYGWANTALNNPDALYGGRWKRDLNIIDSVTSDATKSLWSGRYDLSFSIRAPGRFGDTDQTSFAPGDIPNALAWQVLDYNFFGGVGHIQNGGTLGFGQINPSGRNLVSPITVLNTFSSSLPHLPSVKIPYVASNEYNKVNPYLLLPTDNIVIGWGAATMDDYVYIGNASVAPTPMTASMLTIGAGAAKITLYGSYIREGREYNDGTNQLLSSDSVHEVIE